MAVRATAPRATPLTQGYSPKGYTPLWWTLTTPTTPSSKGEKKIFAATTAQIIFVDSSQLAV